MDCIYSDLGAAFNHAMGMLFIMLIFYLYDKIDLKSKAKLTDFLEDLLDIHKEKNIIFILNYSWNRFRNEVCTMNLEKMIHAA
ncbi:MAG TPA: hypothetical protein DCW90_22580 [Lachnospiraceae bacterium]|nr:hypothetical protein [uncultured Lachnoclostridium sp.]HAU88156.1 hypothetical protein [Lachnospiraceae bacterium]